MSGRDRIWGSNGPGRQARGPALQMLLQRVEAGGDPLACTAGTWQSSDRNRAGGLQSLALDGGGRRAGPAEAGVGLEEVRVE